MDNFVQSSSLTNSFQSQTFKRQLELLDEKILLQEKEYQTKTQMLSSKVKILSESEIKLRNQLTTKDKALYELNSIIKDYQSELMTLKKRGCESESKNNETSNEFNQIRSKFQTISQQLKVKEEEYSTLKEKLSESQDIKERTELKIKELIEVMKQYSHELSVLSRKNASLENDNCNLQNHLKNYQEELKQITHERDTTVKELESLRNKICDLKSMNVEYNNSIKTLKYDNEVFKKEIFDMSQLLSKNMLDMEQNKLLVQKIKKENNGLEEENRSSLKSLHVTNDKLIQLNNEYTLIIRQSNEEINEINQWIECNLCNEALCTSNRRDITKNEKMGMNYNHSQQSKKQNCICLAEIKEKLYSAKTNIANLVLNYEMNTQKCNQQLFNKNEISKRIEKLYVKLCNEIMKNSHREVIPRETKEEVELIDLIEKAISALLNSESSKREYEYAELENSKREAMLIREQYNEIALRIDELKESNQQLLFEITRLNEENKLLDKKNKNLITEIELKQMQINSQEQIINRRIDNTKALNTENTTMKIANQS